MRTRSQARRRRQPQVRQTSVESPNLEKPNNNQETFNPPIVTMDDNRTMAQLLEAPTEGGCDSVVSKYTANNFEIQACLLNLVSKQAIFLEMLRNVYEAWDRFNDLLRGCPHHGFSELHQLDTFYNALNSIDQDSLNSAAGDMVRALILDRKNQTPASAPVKAVEQSCVTCGGGHSYQNCPATNSNIYHDNIQEYVSQAAAANFNQANSGYRPPMVSNQIRPPGFPPIQNPHANSQNNFNRGNNFNQNRGNNFNQGQIYRPPVNQPVAHQGPAPQTHASTSGSGTLPGNTVTNPKEDLKGITTRSGVTIQGPKAVNHDAEVTKDTMPPANNGSTENVQPPVVQIQSRNPNPEPNVAPVVTPVVTPVPKASIPFPSRRNDERRKEKANDQIEKFYEIFRDLSFEISFTDALMLMPKFASTLKTLIWKQRKKLCELAKNSLNENWSAVISNIDDPTSSEVDPTYQDPEGDILNSKLVKLNEESSVDEPPEVELKELPPHLEYAFLEGDDKLPVIIAKRLKDEESALLKVLKSTASIRLESLPI
ncbi:hypothetical protein Tco_1346034 [Tanacetum coccineum]